MVHVCWVHGCKNRSDQDLKRSWYTIPTVRLTQGDQTRKLSEERRRKWLQNIGRKEQPSKYAKLCSDHFLSGKPAELYETTHPDWAPSLKLRSNERNSSPCPVSVSKVGRYKRAQFRDQRKKDHVVAETLLDLSHMEYVEPEPAESPRTTEEAQDSYKEKDTINDSGLFRKMELEVSSQEPVMKCKKESSCSSLLNIKDEPTDEDYDKALIPQSDISVKEDPENEDKKVSSLEPIMKCKEESLCSLLNIKDEATDEDYDKALIPQSDISIKEDPENEDKKTLVPDELRITSVFSVEGDSDDISGLTSSATAAQAPLSLSKDMPVIGGVVSLASAVSGNTALTANGANENTVVHKRTYTPLQVVELLTVMDNCESDGGEELTFDEVDDSDSQLSLELSTDEDTSGKSDGEQCSPPRKKRLGAENTTPAPSVKAKDGTVWDIVGAKRLQQNKFSRDVMFGEKAGPTEYAKHRITSRLQSFLCLFNIEMLMIITDCTVREARRTNDSWSLSVSELMAFVAVLFLRATLCKIGSMMESWSENYAVPVIKETMSCDRYTEIMQYLRFDNKDTRAERVKTDQFAAVSDIWQRFIHNCRLCYVPGQHITVDEQLFPTKVRCPFTQYIATKPDKFGIKFWIAADFETKYVCNAVPYLGKNPSRPKGESLCEDVIMKLMDPFLGKGRTVTTDKFFTSMPLANRLLNHNTRLLGTINKIRREIPSTAKNVKGRTEFSTQVYKSGSATLTVYAPKKNKLVYVLSTMHQHVTVADDRKRKPNTITAYKSMKCGVDIMDKMARAYTVLADTRRWPVAVFYNMLDLAAINAHVLYKACTGSTESRRDFIHGLARELRQQFMLEKATTKKQRPAPGKKTQCQVRTHCNRNHSTKQCGVCNKYTCRKCRSEKIWKCNECEM